MNPKLEYWRNQTLVNRVCSDAIIATEYYVLIKYIVENYSQRMETIQCPLLHLISHCMELSYKEVNTFALQNSYINGNLEQTRKGHDLQKLSEIFIKICDKIVLEESCSIEDRALLTDKVIRNHTRLCSILAADTTLYRYYAKYDRNGNMLGESSPFKNDDESPNIQKLFPLFEDCYSSACYIHDKLMNLYSTER